MEEEKKERIISLKKTNEEEKIDYTLRPKTLEEFIGQKKLKENLKVFIQAAKGRKEPLDHCLFYSPPGLGKTTLAHIIAHEMGTKIKATSGPALEKKGDLAALLTDLSPGDVFFIDEIHRLNRIVEESLYSVMDEFKLDIIIGQGPSAKNIELPVPRFTLIGATTRAGLLTSPLRERFGISEYINFYNNDEMKKIVLRSAKILSVEISEDASGEIAQRARSTPRVANRLLRRVRDFAEVRASGKITLDVAEKSLKSLEIDGKGLDDMDRRILKTIIDKFSGGPVGIETISVAVSEESDTITDVYEPFLIKAGFLSRTPRGRCVTKSAYQHFKLNPPEKEEELF